MADFPYANIVVLGAGMSGLTAAYELSKRYGDRVVVVERERYAGGLAATLRFDRFSADIGSHRIQSTVGGKIRSYITDSLGIELLKQPRRGLLYMQGRTFKYPPSIPDLLSRLPLRTSLSYAASLAGRFAYPRDASNYKSAMLRSVGRKIYEQYYEDYVLKLWGVAPEHIAIEGMKRRKTLFDMKAFLKSITGRNGYFYYPRHGFGAIAERLTERIVANGGRIYAGSRISSMRLDGANRISSLSIVEGGRRGLSFHSPLVLSTIPIDEMNAHVHPGHVAPALPWRAIRIAYLHVSDDIDSAHETFYFPKRDIPCGRISFIKKYSPFVNPATRGTIITCEFPCRVGDGIWEMNDRSLGRLCVNALKTAGVVKRDPATEAVCSVGAEKAYPIYSTDWKKTYDCHKNGLKSIDNLCIFGRRGLFLHCNVDHAIRQGLEAADTISRHPRRPGVYWNERAESFSTCCARD